MSKVLDPFEAALSFRKIIYTKDCCEYQRAAADLRQTMIRSDPNYPRYHFLAPEGWMNDPNGLIFYKGTYHLFFQYKPILLENSSADGKSASLPNKMAWGHAISSDLFHWKDMPVAMWPDSEFDINGVFSGNTILSPNGTPCALYTGNVDLHKETYGVLATSQDDLLNEWSKQVVMSSPPYSGTPTHWDAQLWKKDGIYYQLCGGCKEGKGAANLFISSDLINWDFASTIYTSDYDKFWELPYLIESNGKYALLVGAKRTNPYWIGTFDYDTLSFVPDTNEPQNADTGTYYSYNPSMLDTSGRRIMFGWITGPKSPCASVPYWQGIQSIPREISIINGTLSQAPASEIENLKYESLKFGDINCSNAIFEIDKTTNAYELSFILEPQQKKDETHITLYADKNAVVRIIITPDGDVILEGNTTVRTEKMFDTSIPTLFRIFADGSVFEIYTQSLCDEYSRTSRVMTGRGFSPDEKLLDRLTIEGSSKLSRLTLDKIKCTWVIN